MRLGVMVLFFLGFAGTWPCRATTLTESFFVHKEILQRNVSVCRSRKFSEAELRTELNAEETAKWQMVKSAITVILGPDFEVDYDNVCEASETQAAPGPLPFQERIWAFARKPHRYPDSSRVEYELGVWKDSNCLARVVNEGEAVNLFSEAAVLGARNSLEQYFCHRPFNAFVAYECRFGYRVYEYHGVAIPSP